MFEGVQEIFTNLKYLHLIHKYHEIPCDSTQQKPCLHFTFAFQRYMSRCILSKVGEIHKL